MKFTQEIKDSWLAALRSGKYIQGFGLLKSVNENGVVCYCVLGVLADIAFGLSSYFERADIIYDTLKSVIGGGLVEELYLLNDLEPIEGNPKTDYSNVIPFIEGLEVQP